MSQKKGPIDVTRIVVQEGRLVCELRIADKACRFSSPQLAQIVQQAFPSIRQHACINGVSPTFAAVMSSTPVPHLLEHMIIDLQVREAQSDSATFVGATEWLDEEKGVASVQVSFVDDLQALRALNKAVDFLNSTLLDNASPSNNSTDW